MALMGLMFSQTVIAQTRHKVHIPDGKICVFDSAKIDSGLRQYDVQLSAMLRTMRRMRSGKSGGRRGQGQRGVNDRRYTGLSGIIFQNIYHCTRPGLFCLQKGMPLLDSGEPDWSKIMQESNFNSQGQLVSGKQRLSISLLCSVLISVSR